MSFEWVIDRIDRKPPWISKDFILLFSVSFIKIGDGLAGAEKREERREREEKRRNSHVILVSLYIIGLLPINRPCGSYVKNNKENNKKLI